MARISDKPQLEFIGFDLGHGETALGRAYGGSSREPEILEYRGERTFVTAVAKTKAGVKIGSEAVNMAALSGSHKDDQVWVKFKDRDQSKASVNTPTVLFAQTLFGALVEEKKILGSAKSRVIVGCPSGWNPAERLEYQSVFEGAGLKQVRVVPESRAALMTALEQGYLSLEAAKGAVLIVDIGSSTTDFTYCRDLDAEDVGHNALGSGLLDTLIFELNLARQKERRAIERLITKYPHYRPIMEYWCRLAKEQYFNGDEVAVDMLKRLPIGRGTVFDIRIDSQDAKKILSAKIDALGGQSWPKAFASAVREAVDNLGGRAPETVLLTGGASRLPLVLPACEKAFPKAKVVRGAEPEFAIARGLAWLGRFEYLHTSFQSSVAELVAEGGEVQKMARQATGELGDILAPALVDALTENCVIPAFRDWRRGEIKTLDDIDGVLTERVKTYLQSEDAGQALRPVIEDWFAGLQRRIEGVTDPLCRDHGLPAMVLSLDGSSHVSKHLDKMSLTAPQLANLEQDTAIAGTTVVAIVTGVILAKANLLLPLLTNPIGIALGGAVGVGSIIFGRKALEGKMRGSNVPKIARAALTDGRLRKAASGKRDETIAAVKAAWDDEGSEKFASEMVGMLGVALSERANERAALFLI